MDSIYHILDRGWRWYCYQCGHLTDYLRNCPECPECGSTEIATEQS